MFNVIHTLFTRLCYSHAVHSLFTNGSASLKLQSDLIGKVTVIRPPFYRYRLSRPSAFRQPATLFATTVASGRSRLFRKWIQRIGSVVSEKENAVVQDGRCSDVEQAI